MLIEILFIAALTVINGLLAMSELAVVSARAVRLNVMAEQGSKGAAKALELARQPGRFLSTVQIGITLVGILNGALSGATVGSRLAQWLLAQGMAENLANPLGVGLVVVIITYFSLIVGELVPKQIALRNPEAIAASVARPMRVLAVITTPLVILLDWSGKAVLFALGQGGESENTVTEEEVRGYIAEAENAGVIKTDEHSMISGVMRFADRSAQGLMTPRRDVEVIDLADGDEAIAGQLQATRRSRLPVQDGDADDIAGVILVRELVPALLSNEPIDFRKFVHEAPVVLDQSDSLSVLRAMRESIVHLALVYDEYGHFEGIVTAGDILEAITGAFHEEGEDDLSIVERADGSWLVEGWMPVDEFADRLQWTLPEAGDYETVAGMVLAVHQQFPAVGETIVIGDLSFEIIDLDGRRIDKLLVSRVPETSEESTDA